MTGQRVKSLSMEVSLFPTYFLKLKVSNHKSIKERYLQSFIDGYELRPLIYGNIENQSIFHDPKKYFEY